MVLSKNPDDLLRSLGGCGRYQIRMALVIHTMKTVICWSLIGMMYMMARPPFRCADDFNATDSGNVSSAEDSEQPTFDKKCFSRNGTKCTRFIFDESYMHTAVSDFGLVCDKDWIPSSIMSIQLGGMLVGNFVAGQLADLFGRKRPFFVSLFLLITFSIVCFFATSWPMFAVARIFIGMGSSFFLTIQYSLMSEFSLAEWRAWIIGFPSWPIEACVLSLVLWLIKDWRYVSLTTAFIGVPFIAAWWIIPESFRWYLAHDRTTEAHKVIRTVAMFNRRTPPDINDLKELQFGAATEDRKYTIMDLFKSRTLVRTTLLSLCNWFALGFVSYGVAFGIAELSGSIFLNLFLFNLLNMPSKAIAMWLQNRFGRRYTAMGCYLTTGLAGLAVGIVQNTNAANRDAMANGFAMLAFVGIGTAWGPVQTMTIEVYPTVVRNIGFGFLSTLGRVGAMVGPPIVYLSMKIPGLVYFVVAAISGICVLGLLGLPETKDANLTDKISKQGNDTKQQNGGHQKYKLTPV